MYVLTMYTQLYCADETWEAAGVTHCHGRAAQPWRRTTITCLQGCFRVVSAHSGADFEGHLTNRQRGEHLDSVEVEDIREHPPSAQQRHSAGRQQPAVARVAGVAADW